ncbi:hypothetical protein ANN_16109 [Periplaneta americana]|uniref:Uncharacterized protein n=1 Tax=Periplaneta americana TaxID=6978 RepID=A0ABQ8SI72_PERAM|nr:hypothetical protein ANN_16109 [Periplaneta americana]
MAGLREVGNEPSGSLKATECELAIQRQERYQLSDRGGNKSKAERENCQIEASSTPNEISAPLINSIRVTVRT